MKIVTAGGKRKLVMSRTEWQEMGKGAGWTKTAQPDPRLEALKDPAYDAEPNVGEIRESEAGGMEKRIQDAVIDADAAFWAEIAKAFPEVKTGDVDPLDSHRWALAEEREVRRWLKNNLR